jgi:hypothetical protein
MIAQHLQCQTCVLWRNTTQKIKQNQQQTNSSKRTRSNNVSAAASSDARRGSDSELALADGGCG